MELVEQAVSLDAASEQARSYKTNLLPDMVKLAEMGGRRAEAADYRGRAGEARRRTAELNEQNKKKREAGGRRKAAEEADRPRGGGG